MEKVFFKECFLTDIIKYDALAVWDDMKIGASMELVYESIPFNEEKKCLFAYYKKGEQEHPIGCLSKDDSNMIEQLICMGWKDIFLCRISQVDNDATNDQRIKVAIYIQKCSQN